VAKLTFGIQGPTQTVSYSYDMTDEDAPHFYGAYAQKLGRVMDGDEMRDRTLDEIVAGFVQALAADISEEMTRYKRQQAVAAAEAAVVPVALTQQVV
jgi:hypothetical protein